MDGYTLNEKRLRAQSEKIRTLQEAVRLLGNVALLENVSDEAKGIVQIIAEYSRALTILDDFDHHRLAAPEGTKHLKFELTYEDAKKIIDQMKTDFTIPLWLDEKKTKVFTVPSVRFTRPLAVRTFIQRLEAKAAHLLYFVTKNHSFVDGNKRIAAALFICFLQKNGILTQRREQAD